MTGALICDLDDTLFPAHAIPASVLAPLTAGRMPMRRCSPPSSGGFARWRASESFRDRLRAALPSVRVVGALGDPAGFCIVHGDELDQLYVSAGARGSGVARALIADAEARLSAGRVDVGWLACAIGNERAARFYEKCGWHRAGVVTVHLETSSGIFPLEVWRYEKRLGPGG